MSISDSSLTFLRDLIAAPGPSGYEQPVQQVFRAACAGLSIPTETDVIGNVIATLGAEGSAPSVMIAGHCDEIGFIVTYVHPGGYIYFDPIGGHDANITVGQRVLVHTSEHGALPGVVGKKPIHVLTEEERGRKTVLGDLFIDVGALQTVKVGEMVKVGDAITYAADFTPLQGDLVTSHAFDDRIGVFVVAETLRLLAEKGEIKSRVFGVSTVQEEIGHRGARIAAHRVRADIGIAIDVGHATDYPSADKRRNGDIRLGAGPEITRGANINPEVFKRLVDAARAEEIAVQVVGNGAVTRTDAADMQVSRDGMATALISIPLRYMHSPCEVVHLKDAMDAARLIARFIADLDENVDLTPTGANLHPPAWPVREKESSTEKDA